MNEIELITWVGYVTIHVAFVGALVSFAKTKKPTDIMSDTLTESKNCAYSCKCGCDMQHGD